MRRSCSALLSALVLLTGCQHLPSGSFPGGESSTRSGRVMFDGDRARSGSVGRGSGSSVYAGSGSGSGDKWSSLPMSDPRRIRIGGDVPSPSFPSGQAPKVGAASSMELSSFERFQQSVYSSVYPVLDRLGWGAKRGKGASSLRNPYRMTVHHTESGRTYEAGDTAESLRNIQDYHMRGRGREGKQPFSDIGYHFLIDGSGMIAEGRPSNQLGAHAGKRANYGNFGIALIGQFDKQQPTPQQLDSLKRLSTFLAIRYEMKLAQRGVLEGHSYFAATSCPGKNVIAALPSLRAATNTEMLALQRKGGDGTQYASFVPLTTVLPAAT
ncbi:peptidoglycan recognition family protein [Elusimicrobiota bacterium]